MKYEIVLTVFLCGERKEQKPLKVIMKHILALLIKFIILLWPCLCKSALWNECKEEKAKNSNLYLFLCFNYFYIDGKALLCQQCQRMDVYSITVCSVIRSAIKTRAKLMGRWTQFDLAILKHLNLIFLKDVNFMGMASGRVILKMFK